MPQKVQCKVVEVIPHGDRVYTVLLRPSTPMPRFKAGQFLHLALDPFRPGDFWPESRVFSIASSPSERDLLRITYAVKGRYTTRMESELAEHREVWVKLPYGEFLVDRSKDVCLVAGGTGITAFTAFLNDLPPEHPHELHLFYGARRPELLIYRALAEHFAMRCRTAHAHFFSEVLDGSGEGLLQGRVDVEHISPHLSCLGTLTYYVAGPPAMIQNVSAGLQSSNVPASQVLVDAWE